MRLQFGPHVVEIGNLDKPLFPDGTTKGDLVDYYQRVADVMVVHLKGRPLTLHRFPDGIEKGGFWTKQIARHFPEAAELYARAGWTLPVFIDRVYDPGLAERALGFRCRTDFAAVLRALESGGQLPFAHDPTYVSPKESKESAA